MLRNHMYLISVNVCRILFCRAYTCMCRMVYALFFVYIFYVYTAYILIIKSAPATACYMLYNKKEYIKMP
jgi:hypothetical protein